MMPHLVRSSGAGNPMAGGARPAELSPAQALVAGGRNPNSLSMDERMAGVRPDALFGAEALTSSDLDDIRTTTAPQPTRGFPDLESSGGEQEVLGHIAVGTNIADFRKQTEDIGRHFITAQKKVTEATQKFNKAKQAAKMVLDQAHITHQGNKSLVIADPHVRKAQEAFSQAKIDFEQSLGDYRMYGDQLHELLPGLGIKKLINPGTIQPGEAMPAPPTMRDIGAAAYAPNQVPAAFLTPGRYPAIR